MCVTNCLRNESIVARCCSDTTLYSVVRQLEEEESNLAAVFVGSGSEVC